MRVTRSRELSVLPAAEAEDLARALMLEICVNAELGQTPDIWRSRYYWRAKKRKFSVLEKLQRHCSLDERPEPRPVQQPSLEREENTKRFNAVLCKVWTVQEQCLVRAFVIQELSDAEAAILCGSPSPDAARQMRWRALQKIASRKEELKTILGD